MNRYTPGVEGALPLIPTRDESQAVGKTVRYIKLGLNNYAPIRRMRVDRCEWQSVEWLQIEIIDISVITITSSPPIEQPLTKELSVNLVRKYFNWFQTRFVAVHPVRGRAQPEIELTTNVLPEHACRPCAKRRLAEPPGLQPGTSCLQTCSSIGIRRDFTTRKI